MNKILIVEDDLHILELLRLNLRDAGYTCFCAHDGQQALLILEQRTFDLILLDVMLPQIDGFDLMEYLRPLHIPVIFLTAKADVNDRVKGLKLGAEDYIVKPFEIVELLARIETVLRRYNKLSRYLKIDNLVVDTLSRKVTKGGQTINLTNKEYDILLLFLQNKNIALFRERIYELVWNDMYLSDSRTVDLHVQRVRKKCGLEKRIISVYKVGYRLEVDE